MTSTNPIVANAVASNAKVVKNADDADTLIQSYRNEYREILGNAIRSLESLAKGKVADGVERIKRIDPAKAEKVAKVQDDILKVNAEISRMTRSV